jgi:hypothetical protein
MVMDETKPMTVSDFEALLDRCGSVRDDWPADERTAAETLLEQSSDAQDALRRAVALERMLDTVPAPVPSDILMARVATIPRNEAAHGVWLVVARPVWRPAMLAAAMLAGIYLGAAALPTNTAYGDDAFDLNGIAGGGETLGVIESLEE